VLIALGTSHNWRDSQPGRWCHHNLSGLGSSDPGPFPVWPPHSPEEKTEAAHGSAGFFPYSRAFDD